MFTPDRAVPFSSDTQPSYFKVLFTIGSVVATRGALQWLSDNGISSIDILARHVAGDWNEMDPHDANQNVWAVNHGERVLSTYRLENSAIWVITEADRSVTTLLLPHEY